MKEQVALEAAIVICVRCKEFNFELGGIGLEMEIYASFEGDMDLIRSNRKAMNYGNCRNQMLILTYNAYILL